MSTMPLQPPPVVLSDSDREELQLMLASRTLTPDDIFRANLILMLADGKSYAEIQARLHTTAPTISRWKKRFAESGIEGLMKPRQTGRKSTVITPELKELVIAATCRRPSDGSARWSCRALARALGLSKDVVQRIWRSEGLRPHQLERFMIADDNMLAAGRMDLVALYFKPVQHTAVFRHEKNSTVPDAGTSRPREAAAPQPGRVPAAPRDLLSLYKALSGTSHVKPAKTSRLPREECVSFLTRVVAAHAPRVQFSVILDCLGREEVPRIELFLKEHPNVSLLLTRSHAAWLQRLDEWHSTVDLREDATTPSSPHPLARQVMWHIRAFSKARKTLQWIASEYSDPH